MNLRFIISLIIALLALGLLTGIPASAQGPPVEIHVSVGTQVGPMTSMWAWFGHDEPNYTYMPDGLKLLGELAEASSSPVFVRTHNLLTSGDGTAALKWGSTNAYTEDAQGNPVYDWTIVDRIFDTYVERGIKPLVEIGFISNPVECELLATRAYQRVIARTLAAAILEHVANDASGSARH